MHLSRPEGYYEAHRHSVRSCSAWSRWRWAGFSYTEREKVLDIGPLEATTETRETIPVAPIAGIGAIAGGIALVAVGSRKRTRV